MNNQEVTREIKQDVGAFMNQSEFARYFRVSRDTAIKMLLDCECTQVGKKKMYAAKDAAKAWNSWRG